MPRLRWNSGPRFRFAFLLLALGGSALFLGLLTKPQSRAQNPMPTNTFIDTAAGSTTAPPGADGIVVEGLGGGRCAGYTESALESSTVTFLQAGWYTWSEISPQTVCRPSIAGYQQEVSNVVNYVENNAANASTHWLGIMLDEEWDFGFSVGDLETLNQYVANAVSSTVGVTWWSTELFAAPGSWDQTAFDGIISSSYAAPEIATAYMVQLTNNYQSSGSPVLVTWSSARYPAPYNSETYDDGQVTGPPYNQGSMYWDNEFVPA